MQVKLALFHNQLNSSTVRSKVITHSLHVQYKHEFHFYRAARRNILISFNKIEISKYTFSPQNSQAEMHEKMDRRRRKSNRRTNNPTHANRLAEAHSAV